MTTVLVVLLGVVGLALLLAVIMYLLKVQDLQNLRAEFKIREQAQEASFKLRTQAQEADFADREKAHRKDAIQRSAQTIRGKVAEQLAPYTLEFDFNPRDVRFLGSPVDFVAFCGLSEGQVTDVVFVEVKTGRSGLTQRERQIRDAIEAGEVSYEVIHYDTK